MFKEWKKKIFKNRNKILKVVGVVFLIVILFGVINSYKNLPEGVSLEGEVFSVLEEDVIFLYDLTYENFDGKRVYDHSIFDSIFESIDDAERFILIDMFLWSTNSENYRDLGKELTEHLVSKKREKPGIDIVVITDSFNTGYNAFEVTYFEELENEGIDVVFTDLNKLRDSNLVYSPFWRTFVQIFGEPSKGWIKTPFFAEKSSIRSFLKLLNFKANHRKIMIADNGDKIDSFVISANPSGSGSTHSNVGFLIKDELYKDIYESERDVARFSGYELNSWEFGFVEESFGEKDIQVQFLTEIKIKKGIIEEIDNSEEGDEIKVAMFYFSERDITKALLRASERGVDIEMVLDPSETGFGRQKYGIPTRYVADELVKKSDGKIKIRYYDTEEEQFHTKMIVFVKDDRVVVILGSSNYTRRNIDDLNLEADVKVVGDIEDEFAKDVLEYFEKIYENNGGIYTVDFDFYERGPLLRQIQYRLQELSGASTF